MNNRPLHLVQKMLHTWSIQCDVLLVLTMLEQDVKLDSGIFPLKSEQQAITIPPRRKCHHVREVFWGGALKETNDEMKKREIEMKKVGGK